MTNYRFVDSLPDLIHPDDYPGDPEGRLVRFELRVTPEGVEILGDAASVANLERLLEDLGADEIDQMLCG